MYLHETKELFKDVILMTSEKFNISTSVVEKDYYVTMILKTIHELNTDIVFKGGTSLSKCYGIIHRFSEDIDLAFEQHIGEAKRKKLKYQVLVKAAEILNMPIFNISSIESDKDYNCYHFHYHSIFNGQGSLLQNNVKVETALLTPAFPIEEKYVDSYVRKFLVVENQNLIDEYRLELFSMKVQSKERTFVDKIYALCDYYLQGKSFRYSRHLYDVYKLNQFIQKDNGLLELFEKIKFHRERLPLCLSAQNNRKISMIVSEFCKNDFYKKDYEEVTSYFLSENVSYKECIQSILKITQEFLTKNGL